MNNRLRATTVFSLLLFVFLSRGSADENRYHNPAAAETAATAPSRLVEMVKLVFSISTPYPDPMTSYWNKVKAMINQGKAYFITPNSEGQNWQKEVEVGGGVGGGGGGGAGEKVKAAAVKSFETVEDSVQSAARLTGDAMIKTAETVKNTFSGTERVVPYEAEL